MYLRLQSELVFEEFIPRVFKDKVEVFKGSLSFLYIT